MDLLNMTSRSPIHEFHKINTVNFYHRGHILKFGDLLQVKKIEISAQYLQDLCLLSQNTLGHYLGVNTKITVLAYWIK